MESENPELVAALELENERLRIALKKSEERAVKGSNKCFYCSRKAVVLCDWSYLEPDTSNLDINGRTCDLSLCEDHKHQIQGPILICGSEGLAIETIDFCPRHFIEYEKTGNIYGRAPVLLEKKDPSAINIIQL